MRLPLRTAVTFIDSWSSVNIYKVKLIHFLDEPDLLCFRSALARFEKSCVTGLSGCSLLSSVERVLGQHCLVAVHWHQLKVYWDSVVWLQFVAIG